VYVNRPVDDPKLEEIQHDIVLYKGDSKVTAIDGRIDDTRGDPEAISRLTQEAKALHSKQIRRPSDEAEGYDEQTKERLRRLGYVE
jgi:hypothetical protein